MIAENGGRSLYMVVIYRLCPQGNPLKKRPNGMSKRELVETAYKSFLKTFSCETVFVIDKPEDWILNMVSDRGSVIELETFDWQTGNENSFKVQLQIARQQKEPVLLLEDDYLWINYGAEMILEKAIKDLGFVSPYDHPNHYFEDGYCGPRTVKIAGDHHWQNIVSTTLTFGAKPELIDKYWEDLTSHGTVDDKMWKSIDHKLWSPIPSLATHMETDYLSPTFKWEEIL